MNEHAGGPRLPWEGKAQRADKIIVAAIMISGVYYFATMPLIPWMVSHHAVMLAMIRGGMTSIVTLGAMARVGDVSIWTAVLAGLPATVMFDWSYWWAGRRWGEHSLHMIMGNPSRRTQARLAKVKRWTERYGALAVLTAYYLPVPTVLIYAAAGWAGMSLATFLILDIVGALLWVGLLAGLGYWVGQSAVDVVDKVGDYTLYFTIALVVVVVGRSIVTTRRQLQEIDREAAAAAEAQPAVTD